jgi:hypothetical protein
LVGPFPQERRSAKTLEDISTILAAHDVDKERFHRNRLKALTNAFIAMTFDEQPDYLLNVTDQLDVSFDQTYIQAPTKKRYWIQHLESGIAEQSKKERGQLAPGPVDAFVGHHTVSGERPKYRRGEDALDKKFKIEKAAVRKWGWVANLAVRADSESPTARRTPGLIVAATLSLPSVDVPEEAVDLLRNSNKLGLTPGLADADKEYWAGGSTVERLHDPAFALGWAPSTDYRIDRLLPSGEEHGARFLEGNVYCPSTAKHNLSATFDYFNGDVDKTTFLERKEELKASKLHVKDRKPNGKMMMRCPALGPSPTVTCPLRELAQNAAEKARPSVDEEDLHPTMFLDDICTKHSVAMTLGEGRKHFQGFEYGLEPWETFHQHARNSVESVNAQIKRGGRHDLESSSRRRVRGLAGAQLMMTMVITASNLDKIAAFIHDHLHTQATGGPKPKKARASDSKWHNPYINTYPEGVALPPDAKPRRGRLNTSSPPPLR